MSNMISIPVSTATRGFVTDIHFQRTEAIKDKVADCTKEELQDFIFYMFGELETTQAMSENFNLHLEKILGYHNKL